MFIPQTDFERIQPQNTFDVQPSQFLPSSPPPPQNFEGAMFRTQIPIADNQLKVASIQRKLPLQDIETRRNDLNEKIVVNNNF